MTAADAHWTDRWADRPPLPLDWFPVTGDEAVAVLARLDRVDDGMEMGAFSGRHPLRQMRAAALPFYHETLLLDLQVDPPEGETGPAAIASAILGASGVLWLDGTAPPIHLRNAEGLDLSTPDLALAYLRFFCAFIRGEGSPFLVTDSLADLDFGEDLAADERDRLAALINPPDVSQSDGNWRINAVVLYSGNLFRATFEVPANGMVRMVEDQQVAECPDLRPRRYRGIYRFPPG